MTATRRILLQIDIAVLRILSRGRAGIEETISASVWGLELAGKWQGRLFRPAVDLIMRPFDGVEHCRNQWESWQKRAYNLAVNQTGKNSDE